MLETFQISIHSVCKLHVHIHSYMEYVGSFSLVSGEALQKMKQSLPYDVSIAVSITSFYLDHIC